MCGSMRVIVCPKRVTTMGSPVFRTRSNRAKQVPLNLEMATACLSP
jgi:hypothetical protein